MKKINNYLCDFPTLKNNDIAYFDYSATTFMPNIVFDKWNQSNIYCGVSIGRGNNVLTKRAKQQLEEAEKIFHNFFGLPNEYDLIYTKNVTESINLVSISLKNELNPLDIILVGPYEHHSNYLPWRKLAQETGAMFFEIPMLKNDELDYEFIKKYKDRIKIISISSVANTNGYYIDVNKISNIINDDTYFLVDQSQLTAHKKIISNKKIGVHFISSHKMYGPKNISLIAVKTSIIEKMEPVILGGGMVENVGYETKWNNGRMKFFSGTIDISLIAAFAEACKYINKVTYEKIAEEDKINSEIIKKCLLNNGYKIINSNNSVNYIISFYHKDIHPHDINEYLSQKNIIIRSGNICSQNSLRKLNINAINRISLGIGITKENLEKLCNELGAIVNE